MQLEKDLLHYVERLVVIAQPARHNRREIRTMAFHQIFKGGGRPVQVRPDQGFVLLDRFPARRSTVDLIVIEKVGVNLANEVVLVEHCAAELWQQIVNAAYDTAEPGVLFVDRINECH